jgi:hypothetical protein
MDWKRYIASRFEPETLAYVAANPSFSGIGNLDGIIKAIKYGSGVTLTSVVANLSTVNGTAFVTNPTFTYTGLPSNDLSWLDGTGWKVSLSDGSKTAYAYAKAKGSGETYNAIIDGGSGNGNMEIGSPPTVWIGSSATLTQEADERTGGSGSYSMKVVTTGALGCAYQNVGQLQYKLIYIGGWIKKIAGTSNSGITISSVSPPTLGLTSSSASWVEKKRYYTPTVSSSNIELSSVNDLTLIGEYDDIVLKVVLTPSASGLTLTSTALGATYNMASVESGFNPNKASFTATITRN